MMDARILERKQRRAARFEFVHETWARVREENLPQRIDGKRGVRWFRARQGAQRGDPKNPRARPSPNGRVQMGLAQNIKSGNRPIPPAESYHADLERFSAR